MEPLVVAAIIAPLAVLLLLAIGVPVGFTLFCVGFLGMFFLKGWNVAIYMIGTVPYSSTAKFLMVVVPLFIIMGHFSFSAGLADKAYSTAYKIMGRLRGGLAIASTLACGLFAATTGSSAATAATIGKVAIPQMEKYGYRSGFAAAAICAGGSLGVLIPPSVILVIYAMITGLSVAKLLIAGVLPGILSIILYSMTIWIISKIDPKAGPPGESTTMRERIKSLGGIWGFILLIFVVLGSIYAGVATPTQAAALGAFMAFIMAIPAYSKKPRELIEALNDTVLTTSMVFIIVAGASLFTMFLTASGLTSYLTQSILGMNMPRLVILVVLILFYVPLGMFLDPISILLITVPLAFPVITGLGYDGTWFGIIITMMIEFSYLTPPLGFNVFIVHGIAPHIPLETIFRECVPFLIAEAVIVALMIAFPQIATFLPSLMTN